MSRWFETVDEANAEIRRLDAKLLDALQRLKQLQAAYERDRQMAFHFITADAVPAMFVCLDGAFLGGTSEQAAGQQVARRVIDAAVARQEALDRYRSLRDANPSWDTSDEVSGAWNTYDKKDDALEDAVRAYLA